MTPEAISAQASIQAMQHLAKALLHLSNDVLPKSEQWFALQADGFLEHLRRIEEELSAYVCEVQNKMEQTMSEQAMTEQEAAKASI